MKYYYIYADNGYCGYDIEEYVMSNNFNRVERYARDISNEVSFDFMSDCIDVTDPDAVAVYGEQSGAYELEELTQAEAHELITKGVDFLEM